MYVRMLSGVEPEEEPAAFSIARLVHDEVLRHRMHVPAPALKGAAGEDSRPSSKLPGRLHCSRGHSCGVCTCPPEQGPLTGSDRAIVVHGCPYITDRLEQKRSSQ